MKKPLWAWHACSFIHPVCMSACLFFLKIIPIRTNFRGRFSWNRESCTFRLLPEYFLHASLEIPLVLLLHFSRVPFLPATSFFFLYPNCFSCSSAKFGARRQLFFYQKYHECLFLLFSSKFFNMLFFCLKNSGHTTVNGFINETIPGVRIVYW